MSKILPNSCSFDSVIGGRRGVCVVNFIHIYCRCFDKFLLSRHSFCLIKRKSLRIKLVYIFCRRPAGRTRKMCREDDPGSSSMAAERVIPEVPSSANTKDVESPSWKNAENMLLLNRILRYTDNHNGLLPPCFFYDTDFRDLERAVNFLKSWKALGGSPASLRHNQDFKLCKKLWFPLFYEFPLFY